VPTGKKIKASTTTDSSGGDAAAAADAVKSTCLKLD